MLHLLSRRPGRPASKTTLTVCALLSLRTREDRRVGGAPWSAALRPGLSDRQARAPPPHPASLLRSGFIQALGWEPCSPGPASLGSAPREKLLSPQSTRPFFHFCCHLPVVSAHRAVRWAPGVKRSRNESW